MLLNFTRASLQHTPREINSAAHLLVREALKLQEDIANLNVVPYCIISKVFEDMT